MELPEYRLPGPGVVLRRMLERGGAFVRQAGTLIFAVTIVVWAAGYYPRNPSRVDATLRGRKVELESQIDRLATISDANVRTRRRTELQQQLDVVEGALEGAYLRQSFLGRMGRFIEPAVKPLGWDWRIGCAVIASFPAREVVIATLAVIYNLGEEAHKRPDTLRETLRAAKREGSTRPMFTTPVALSIMVFFALCAQCVSTLAVIRSETNSWRWPIFTFTYMTTLAYLGALVTYQVGMLFVS
jgi:ferrous iron transport protein B